MIDFAIELAEYLELAFNACLEDDLKIYISSLKKKLDICLNANEKENLLLNEYKIFETELQRKNDWETFINEDKRIEFFSQLIHSELKKTDLKNKKEITSQVQSTYPYRITDKDSCFSLKIKVQKKVVNINIESTKLFWVYFPLLSRLKIEYLKRKISGFKPELAAQKIKKNSSEKGTLQLNQKFNNLKTDDSLLKCLESLRDNEFVKKETKLPIFKKALSGATEVERVVWIGTPVELKKFIDLIKPCLINTAKFREKTANSFVKMDGTSYTSAGQRGPKQEIKPERMKQLRDAVTHLNPQQFKNNS